MWARQLAIMAAPTALSQVPAIPQTAVPVAEVLIFIILQYKWRPYAERRQNRLELSGLCISLLVLVLSVVYFAVGSELSTVVDIVMLASFFGLWAMLGIYFVRNDTKARRRSIVEAGMIGVPAAPSPTQNSQWYTSATADGPVTVEMMRLEDIENYETAHATFEAGPLGMGLRNVIDHPGTIMVTSVDAGTQAAAQGVPVGAIVSELNGESVRGLKKSDFLDKLRDTPRPLTVGLLVKPADGSLGDLELDDDTQRA